MAAPDPYLPGHGDTRYRVRHYDLALDYKVMTNHLRGRAVLDVEVLEPTAEIELDLANLQVAKVQVDGATARYRARPRKVAVAIGDSAPGRTLTLHVAYSGKPRPVRGIAGACGWEELTDGVLVGSQPDGAPSWFPCNDHAGDKATYRIEVAAASGYAVLVNGSLEQSVRRGSVTAWTYVMDRPMAPYLATVQIGRYVADRRPGPVPVELWHPAGLPVDERTAFEQQVQMVRVFTDLFGPYPFAEYRVVVTDDPLEIPLEAQGMSSFGRNFVPPTWDNERLVAHELSHQWFGNAVTAARAQDIWLHEGFACYSEWLWSQASGRDSAQHWARHHHGRLAALPQDLVVGAPGARDMFDDRVYKRGALTVHALRAAMGDGPFFDMVRAWTTGFAGRAVATEDFAAHCERFTTAPVREVLDAWLYQPRLPALPVV